MLRPSDPEACDELIGRSEQWRKSDAVSRNARVMHDAADNAVSMFASSRAFADNQGMGEPRDTYVARAGQLPPRPSGVWPASEPRSSNLALDDHAAHRFMATQTRSRMYRTRTSLPEPNQIAP